MDKDGFLLRAIRDFLCASGNESAGRLQALDNAVDFASLLRTGPHGKPYLTGALEDIYFSYSHSGRYQAALCALCEVGLDIEDISERPALDKTRLMNISSRFFAADECKLLEEAGYGQEEFFRVWTGKESYVKFTGGGIAQGLQGFSILDPPGRVDLRQIHVPDIPDIICSCCLPLLDKPDNVTIIYYG